jgi:hypothetical protein
MMWVMNQIPKPERRVMKVVEIRYIDYGVAGEYGMFGKCVARSDVRGMTTEQIRAEKCEMKRELGQHIVPIEVEEVPGV